MPAAKPLDEEQALALFHRNLTWTESAQKLGISPNRLKRVWVKTFGESAVKERARKHVKGAPPEAMAEAMASFHTDEPFKVLAKRLGISPNTLRAKWVEKYGQGAFDARGTRLQSKGATAYGARSRGKAKNYSTFEYSCEECRAPVVLTKLQKARTTKVTCKECRDKGKGTICPVCGLACKGVKGLASHFRHADDEAHRAHLDQEDVCKWEGLTEEVDYTTCRVCGFRGASLFNHLKLHKITAQEYKDTYGVVSLMCSKSMQKKSANTRQFSYDLSQEGLRSFEDDQGRVVVAAAAAHYQCREGTILRYCREYGLVTKNRLAWQKAVLDQAKEFLEAEYEWEWSHPQAVNPDTGRVFNYDGFFPTKGVVVEAHGDQHFTYSERWHLTKENFQKLRQRDILKRELVEKLGLQLKVVRPSDPIYDPEFWRRLFSNDPTLWENFTLDERIRQEGVLIRELKGQGWPEKVAASDWLLKAELAKLKKMLCCVDDNGVIHPYSVRGTTACASFFPNRYDARVGHAPSVREAWDDDVMLRKAIRLQLDSGHPTTPERIVKALVFFCRCPSVFRPAVAKYVYQTYCPSGGVTWDPCAGYGGRLMGAQAAGVGRYIATDVEPLTAQGNKRLAEALGYGDRVEIHEARAESFDPGVPLDLVFTSPPYFDLEVYGSESKKAARDYGSASGWVRHFLTPVISTAFKRLKEGGHLALNLPFRPVGGLRLDLAAEKVAEEAGFEALPSVYLPLRSKTKSGKKEPVLIWHKLP